jgi:hypothetical protein
MDAPKRMPANMTLNWLSGSERGRLAKYWLPIVAAAFAAGLVFVILGKTPFVRAVALGATIGFVALTLRRFGALLAFTGGLALAFSPAFWSQTGGSSPATFTTIVILLTIAAIAGVLIIWFGKRPGLGLTLGLIIFTVLFWVLVGTPRSLRLTTFFSAGLIYVLIDALFTANPRPDEINPSNLKPYHIWGLLLFLTLGILNDALFTLVTPAVILGLFLSRASLPRWYWIVIAVLVLVGLRGMSLEYLNSTWWTYPAAQAEVTGIRVPFMMADGWRDPSRWLALLNLVSGQFTIIGVLLGVLGLARLARWYPPLGVVTMIAYAAYAVFGLVYFGRDSAVLLLPLLMIQVIWMTYAVFTFGQWLQKSTPSSWTLARFAAPVIFTLLPLLMLLRIAGVL